MYIRKDANALAMAYRKPDDDRLEKAILAVIGSERQIRSQKMMTDLVLNELRKEHDDYRVSGERIRRVAIERNILKIDIEYNQHDDRSSPDVCPVCGYPMAIVSNSTLKGGAAKIGRQCTKCPYQTGAKRRSPGRYTFSKGQLPAEKMGTGARIALLKDASELMKRAAAMVESATKGTEQGARGKRSAARIRKISSAKKDGDSLANIIKDIGSGDKGQTVWTRPLESVKDANRKDI